MAVAGLAAVVGLALLVLTVGATWRSRLRDREALRLLGVRRRTVRGAAFVELVTVVTASTGIGAAIGVVGARLILPKLPLFAGPPAVPIPERIAVEWGWALWLTGGLLAALAAVALAIALRVVTARPVTTGWAAR